MQRTLEASREEGSWGLKRRDRTAQVTNSGQNRVKNRIGNVTRGKGVREDVRERRKVGHRRKKARAMRHILGWKTDKAAVIPEGGEQGGRGTMENLG